jgi:hypothetical protein
LEERQGKKKQSSRKQHEHRFFIHTLCIIRLVRNAMSR